MTEEREVVAVFAPLRTLTVLTEGEGSVTSDPAGVDCPDDCEGKFDDESTATLTATPADGWRFDRWSGDCSSETDSCEVTMNADREVTAIFLRLPTLLVTVEGSGTVTSNPAGIDCPDDCEEPYLLEPDVDLTATPGTGWAFLGWSGDCTGSGACQVTMTDDRLVTATFGPLIDIEIVSMELTGVSPLPAGTVGQIVVEEFIGYTRGPADGPVSVPVEVEFLAVAPDGCTVDNPFDSDEAGPDASLTVPFGPRIDRNPTKFIVTFDVRCTEPSFHDFVFTNTVTIDPDADVVDRNPNNNTRTEVFRLASTAEVDASVDSIGLAAGAPTEVEVKEFVTVTVEEEVSYRDLSGGFVVDSFFDVFFEVTSLPDDCNVTPPEQTVRTRLSAGQPATVEADFEVRCGRASFHEIEFTNTIRPADEHALDTNPDNDSLSTVYEFAVIGQLDALVGTLGVSGPSELGEGQTQAVTVDQVVIYTDVGPGTNVPSASFFDVFFEVTVAPLDCTVDPASHTVQVDLQFRTGATLASDFDVTCTEPGRHEIEFTNTIAVADPHVTDPNPDNDSRSGIYEFDVVATCGGLPVTILGTAGDDDIEGTAGDDVIHGLGGNDRIRGRDGNDTICAGDGNDRVYGQDGDDTIFGQDGDDVVYAGRGNDEVSGGPGRDRLKGEDGEDTLDGGDDDDTLIGGDGDDIASGGLGDDRFYGGDDNDIFDGGPGVDVAYGGRGNDMLRGGDDDDRLRGEKGDDWLIGGSGNDSLKGSSGNDRSDGGPGNDTFYGGDGNDRFFGGSGADVAYGDDGNDHLIGGTGPDKLKGYDGDDICDGTVDADVDFASSSCETQLNIP